MWTTSERFLATLRVGHKVAVRATIEQAGFDPVEVPVIGGSVSLDRTSATTTTGQLVLPWTLAEDGVPVLGLDLRTLPYGAYALLERGVQYADGTREYVPLGRLRINAVSWRTSESQATLDLADRMSQLADRTLAPWTPAGMSASEAAVFLVQSVFPGLTCTDTTPASADLVGVTYEGTYESAVVDLANSVGAFARFTRLGDFVIQPRVIVPGSPVWSVDSGAEGVFVDADEALDRTATFSEVIVRGQTTADPPVPIESAPARDTDPTSPTYWLGPFGQVTLVYDSAAVQTQAAADALAAHMLTEHLGLARSLTVDTVPNPGLELSDTVRLTFPDGRDELHLIEALSIPLDATSPTSLVARSSFLPGEAALAGRSLRTDAALAMMAP